MLELAPWVGDLLDLVVAIELWVCLPVVGIWWAWHHRLRRYKGTMYDSARPGGF